MSFDSVIVRYMGEIGIKSEGTKRVYTRLLRKNIQKTLKHYAISYEDIVQKRGRIYVKTTNTYETALKLTRVFGISSVSEAIQVVSDMESIVETAVKYTGKRIKRDDSFAVRCRRVGKHAYSSMDVCKEVGSNVLQAFDEKNLKVNLKNPQFTLNIEVRGNVAFIFSETMRGFGGFPMGSQAKVVGLLSGGIDSPVACWLVMKRGCPLIPIHFITAPLDTQDVTKKILAITDRLFEWSISYPRKIYLVPFQKNLETFTTEAPKKVTCILCKRLMYRVAERIADQERAEGVVTGESIGEQASQTITNLRVLTETATKYPIHRPLLGFDKIDIEKVAKEIGTFHVSTQAPNGCNAAPSKPTTQANLEEIKHIENKLHIEKMLEETVCTSKCFLI